MYSSGYPKVPPSRPMLDHFQGPPPMPPNVNFSTPPPPLYGFAPGLVPPPPRIGPIVQPPRLPDGVNLPFIPPPPPACLARPLAVPGPPPFPMDQYRIEVIKSTVPPNCYSCLPPTPRPIIVKDELAIKQEEFIKKCMYPSRKNDLLEIRPISPEEQSKRGSCSDNIDIFRLERSKSPIKMRNRERSKSPVRKRKDRSRERNKRAKSSDRRERKYSARGRSRTPPKSFKPQVSYLDGDDEIKRSPPILRRFNLNPYSPDI